MLDSVYAIYMFILGTIMGSFFNVVAHRLSNNESIIKPGSHCESCQHLLKWYELSHAWNEFIDINVLVLRRN